MLNHFGESLEREWQHQEIEHREGQKGQKNDQGQMQCYQGKKQLYPRQHAKPQAENDAPSLRTKSEGPEQGGWDGKGRQQDQVDFIHCQTEEEPFPNAKTIQCPWRREEERTEGTEIQISGEANDRAEESNRAPGPLVAETPRVIFPVFNSDAWRKNLKVIDWV